MPTGLPAQCLRRRLYHNDGPAAFNVFKSGDFGLLPSSELGMVNHLAPSTGRFLMAICQAATLVPTAFKVSLRDQLHRRPATTFLPAKSKMTRKCSKSTAEPHRLIAFPTPDELRCLSR